MKVLIVEDDLALADVVTFTLRREGYDVIARHDGLSGFEAWATERPALVILDLNLPKMDGMAVCQRIRSEASTPIIILSVRGEDDDVVRGLELGADDYIAKPFSPRQLVARVQAVLRRAGVSATSGSLVLEEITLETTRLEVRFGDRPPIQLTVLECRLLEALMINSGHVLPAETLISSIWGPVGGDRAMLKQLVYRLRKKIESEPTQAHLDTIPGVGYAFSTEASR